jgi:copper homeostasis protein (lipoprotein)
MKKELILAVYLVALIGLGACKSKFAATDSSTGTEAHNSMNSVDWEGTYRGMIPCADCPGIETEITLNKDLTYSIRRKYLGRDNAVFETKGNFSWSNEGSIVSLDGDGSSYYQVGENKIILLDKDKKRIKSNFSEMYIFTKAVSGIAGRYWKLVEIGGQPLAGPFNKEPFIQLDTISNRITGTGGCNTFGGSFKLKANNGLEIGSLMSTKMACQNMETEQQLLKVLESVDSYIVKGDTLILNRARMAPLAQFIAAKRLK